MMWFIFAGDMLVMAFMVGLAIWYGTRGDSEQVAEMSRIPLEDENHNG